MKRAIHNTATFTAACLSVASFVISARAWQGNAETQSPSPAGAPPASASGASTTGATVTPETVVLRAGNQQVTAGELDALVRGANPAGEPLSPVARKTAAEQYATMLALAQEGEKRHVDQSPEFQRQLGLLRTRLLAQAAFRDTNAGVRVSPEEINQYYSEHVAEYEQVEVRQFTVNKRSASAPANAPGLPEAEARARLAEIRKAVESGAALDKVAKDFGVAGTVVIDVQPRQLPVTSLTPETSNKLLSLKDGQSTADIESPQTIMFMQLVKRGKKDVQQVSSQIETRLHQQKVRNAMEELKKQANIWIDPNYAGASVSPGSSSAPGSSAAPAGAKPQPPTHP